MSKFPLSRFVPVLKDLVNRRSTWFVRWPYSTPWGTRSIVIPGIHSLLLEVCFAVSAAAGCGPDCDRILHYPGTDGRDCLTVES